MLPEVESCCIRGTILYFREDIPAKGLNHSFPSTESFFVETILYKKKWLINCSCKFHKSNIKNDLEIVSRMLDAFSLKYENILLLGNFILCSDDETMKNICSSSCLKSLIKQPTCF